MKPAAAGARASERAQRLSDELLDVEETCLAAVRGDLAEAAPDAGQVLRAGIRRSGVGGLTNDTRMRRGLGLLLDRVAAASVDRAAALAGLAASWATDAIAAELSILEEALPASSRGFVPDAEFAARGRHEELVEAARAQQEAAGEVAVARFDKRLTELLFRARSRGFEPGRLETHMFGAAGLWWTPAAGLCAAARACSIRTANGAREAAIEVANQLAAGEQQPSSEVAK